MNYEDFKNNAMANEPLAYKVSLTEIGIVDENTIRIKGFTLPCNPGVFKDLGKILKVPQNFIKDFEQSFGKDGKLKFLNFIKDAVMLNRNMVVSIIGDKLSKRIIGIAKGEFMPYEMYFRIFDELMNKHDFEIKDMIFDNNRLTISSILRKGQFNVGGMDQENFYPGFTFRSDVESGTTLDSYIYRLVCSNGMIAPDANDPINFGPNGTLGGPTADDFFRRIDKLNQNGLIPTSFRENVTKAINTKASFSEVKAAASQIERINERTKLAVDSFIPVNSIKAQLAAKGVKLSELNPQQEKTIITGISVWDIVNGITEFASHDFGLEVAPNTKLGLQMHANAILTRKSFDTANLINVTL